MQSRNLSQGCVIKNQQQLILLRQIVGAIQLNRNMWEKGISDGLGRADEDSNKIRADEDRLIKLEEEAI